MFGSLGGPEIAIIGVVVILLFGVGKLSGLGKDLGSSVKEFRKAIKDEDDKPAPPQQAQVQPPQQQQYVAPPQPQYAPAPPQQEPQHTQPVAPPVAQPQDAQKKNIF